MSHDNLGLLSSGFHILGPSVASSRKSIMLSSSCLSVASAVSGSVGRSLVLLIASAAEFLYLREFS